MRRPGRVTIVNHLVDDSPLDANLDAAFAALTDPTRRDVVGRLAILPLGTVVSVSALAAPYPMSLQAVSKHLLVLERAGLITCQKSGRVRRCHLMPAPLRGLSAWIESHRSFWEGQFYALDRFLETTGTQADTIRGERE